MAQAERSHRRTYAPSRVYSYSRAATAEALPEYAPRPKQAPAPERTHSYEHVRKTRVKRQPTYAERRKASATTRLVTCAFVLMTAAVMLFIVIRYAAIAEEYNSVNDIRNDIALSERRISQLQVELDGAVDLEDARETARAAGLGYPTAAQIVEVDGVLGAYENMP